MGALVLSILVRADGAVAQAGVRARDLTWFGGVMRVTVGRRAAQMGKGHVNHEPARTTACFNGASA